MHHYQQSPLIGMNQQLDNRRSQLHKAFNDLAKLIVNRGQKVLHLFVSCLFYALKEVWLILFGMPK